MHLGPTKTPYDIDETSGLRLGDSQERAGSFRGLFHEHTLKVDGERKKLQLDAGPEVTFKGDEFDLLVENAKGGTLYVDVDRPQGRFLRRGQRRRHGPDPPPVHGRHHRAVMPAL